MKQFDPHIINDCEILLTNKKVFKDDEEHSYIFNCYDGIAYGHLKFEEFSENAEDNNKKAIDNLPFNMLLSYPTIAELRKSESKCAEIRRYCGLSDDEPINYNDIALRYGKMGKYGFNSDELNLIEKIARANKVDTWLDVTREGNFRDREEGKEISAKKAMCWFIDALQYEDFAHLTTQEKFMLLKSMCHILK